MNWQSGHCARGMGTGEFGPRELLANDQHFADVIAGEKEFDGSKVAKKIFYVSIVEDSLQTEIIRPRTAVGPFFCIATRIDKLHLQCVQPQDVITVTGRVRPRFLGMKERQQTAAGFEQ